MKNILFDLDGTLLPIDTDVFISEYFKLLTKKIKPYILEEEFFEVFWEATEAMMKDSSPNKTNKDVFFEVFMSRLGEKANKLIPVFDDFYANEFKLLSTHVIEYRNLKNFSKEVNDKFQYAALATNPVFPEAAILERLSWIGLDKNDFDLITSYENMHFCKPKIEYYEEILDFLQIDPVDTIMVGNDTYEDLIVCKLNIKTFLVDNYLINKKNSRFTPSYRGSFDELVNFIKNFKTC